MSQDIDLGAFDSVERRARIEGSSRSSTYKDINDELATVEVVVATGVPVLEKGVDKSGQLFRMYRTLEISEDAIDWSRLRNKASVLDNHRRDGKVGETLGSVNSSWIEQKEDGTKELVALLNISKISRYQKEVAANIKNGILGSVSVGAKMLSQKVTARNPDGSIEVLATRWKPEEVSIVKTPADGGAVIRNDNFGRDGMSTVTTADVSDAGLLQKIKNLILRAGEPDGSVSVDDAARMGMHGKKKLKMADDDDDDDKDKDKGKMAFQAAPAPAAPMMAPAAQAAPVAPAPAPAAQAAPEPAPQKKEGSVTLSDTQFQMLLNQRATRSDLGDDLGSISSAPDIQSGASVASPVIDGSRLNDNLIHRLDIVRNQMSDAITYNMLEGLEDYQTASGIKIDDNPYRYDSLTDMAKELLYQSGDTSSRRMDGHDIFNMFFGENRISRSTSGPIIVKTDFKDLLLDSVNKSIMASYDAMRGEQTFLPFTSKKSLKDFKKYYEVQAGESPPLQKVAFGANAPLATFSDTKESYSASQYQVIMQVTRDVIVNDDTGQLQKVINSGKSVAAIESDLVWEQFLNGTVGGQPLYSSANGNLATGVPLDSATTPLAGIKKMREDMMMQTGLDTDEALNFPLGYLVVPPALLTSAEEAQAKIYPAKVADANVVGRLFKIITESRLQKGISRAGIAGSSSNYYGVSRVARATRKFIILGTVQKGSMKRKFQEKFENDALQWKLSHDVVAKVVDRRLSYKCTA